MSVSTSQAERVLRIQQMLQVRRVIPRAEFLGELEVSRPGDRFTITGLAGTFLKIAVASFLVRAVLAAGAMLLFVILAAIVYVAR